MNKVTKIFIAHNNCNTILNEISNSLLDSTKQENFEIILVDNGSTDGTYQYIIRCDPKRKIRYVRFKDKVDYNVARAKGIELATSEFIEIYSLTKNTENQTISLGVYWNDMPGDELEYVVNLLNSVMDNICITVYHNKNNSMLCSNVNEVITDDEQEIPYLCLKRSDDILLFSYKNYDRNIWYFLNAVFKSKITAIGYWNDRENSIDKSHFMLMKNNNRMEIICSDVMKKEWLNSQMYDYRSVKIDNVRNSSDDDLLHIVSMWQNELVKLKRINSNTEKFATCTVDNISYIATVNDASIMPYMKHTGCNFSKENIDIFYYLANKYYDIKNKQGFFIDIGANIGTTSVYFKKNLDHNINLIAFEPGKMNYKLLLTNYILNDIEEGSRIENVGLGNVKGTSVFHICEFNPGASSVLLDYSAGNKDEVIQITTLDDYLLESGINANDIKYMWIDVEGMEPLVIEGAMKTLSKNPVPIHMEFSPHLWNDTNKFNEIVSNLQTIYSKFMYISEVVNGKEIAYDIRELYKRKNDQFGVIDDIFLIP